MRDGVSTEIEKTKELAAKWRGMSVKATKVEQKRDAHLFRLLGDLDGMRAKVLNLPLGAQRKVLGGFEGWGGTGQIIRLLLKNVCPQLDAKKRAKYAAVLRYVAAKKESGETVKDFVRKNGGLNGCVAKEKKLR
jgi:hypothetical protein